MIRSLIYKDDIIKKENTYNDIVNSLNNDTLIWVDIEKPSDDEISILSDVFHFHPLAIEDTIIKQQRSKVDNYKNYYFIIFNAFKGRDINKRFIYSEIYIFLAYNYIVTIHWENLDIIDNVFKRTEESTVIFKRGIDFILHDLFDAVVDDYLPLTDKLGERIDIIEEVILKDPKKEIQSEILNLKRNMLKLRRILSPQREVINILLRHDFDIIKEDNRLYFMDVYDHLLRIFDLIDTYQDLLAGTLDLYMSQISNRMNEVMKVLTIITTVMMPLTLITGIYGMNFKYMPELNWNYGYYAALFVMGLIVLIEIIIFKVKKWM
ncbi:magnesium/cobalt transporter CorA [Thermoanaerobacterium sp. RBIITD]|uniref:magnesium/cobalt transporter CorA n=1 Tax=Thermoanaerobacterium sp. RBIITD TaxID=1550240 RepID=UPI000BB8496D|nr:magnesium/cobalt transporter CorA [Thermoanaerobacterium sp. RBIITD]SNX53201.1 magnesium transporter [Thermoanaerobacterium sp. RBIITD]